MERYLAFRAVAEQGGFSRAAEHLHRTQPAISQAVASLEEELGEMLFVRDGREVRLTHAGQLLLAHVQPGLDELERGRLRVLGLGELREGSLSISASDTTTMYVLPGVLREFRARYPGVELSISNDPSPRAARKVLSRDADLALVTLPLSHPRLDVSALSARHDVVICGSRHELAARARASLRQLAGYRWLLLDKTAHTRRVVDERFDELGLCPMVAMELSSLEVIKRLVELGLGISVAPRLAIDTELRQGRLHAIEAFGKRATRWLGVATLRRRVLSPAAERFIELLKRELSPG